MQEIIFELNLNFLFLFFQWYEVDLNRIPDDLHLKFYQLDQDDETEEFLEICYEKADWIFTQIWNALVRSLLSWFMSNTSING